MRLFIVQFIVDTLCTLNSAKYDLKPINPACFFKRKDNIIAQLNKSLQKKKYYLEIYLTYTGDGSAGHVSASTIQETEQGAMIIKHTSYRPTFNKARIHLATLSFLPVYPEFPSPPDLRMDDLDHADEIIRIPLSDIQFNNVLKKQHGIEKGNSNQTNMYSVFAHFNPLTLFIAMIVSYYKEDIKTINQFINDTGCYPPEDHTGILVTSLIYHPQKSLQIKLLNC